MSSVPSRELAVAVVCLQDVLNLCEHAYHEGLAREGLNARAIAHSMALGAIWSTVRQAFSRRDVVLVLEEADGVQRNQAGFAQLQAFRLALHAEFGEASPP